MRPGLFSLGLLTVKTTVSPVSHSLWLTRRFHRYIWLAGYSRKVMSAITGFSWVCVFDTCSQSLLCQVLGNKSFRSLSVPDESFKLMTRQIGASRWADIYSLVILKSLNSPDQSHAVTRHHGLRLEYWWRQMIHFLCYWSWNFLKYIDFHLHPCRMQIPHLIKPITRWHIIMSETSWLMALIDPLFYVLNLEFCPMHSLLLRQTFNEWAKWRSHSDTYSSAQAVPESRAQAQSMIST